MGAGRRLFTVAFLTAAALSAIAVPASAVTPKIALLAPLPNGPYGIATGINDSGVIVGSSGRHTAKWTPDGGVTDLGTLPNRTDSIAHAINNNGTIVGISYVVGEGFTATRWAPNGAITALANPPGYSSCSATAINDSGVIVGNCGTDADVRAVRWNPDGTVILLAMPPGDRATHAWGINSAGTIVGSSTSPTNTGTRAGWWNPDGSFGWLANLPDGVGSEARGINDSGQIAGTIVVSPPGIVEYAVRWNTDGTVTTLPTPVNAPRKHGRGHKISSNGTIIGETRDAQNYVAAVWSPNGTLTILPGLGTDPSATAKGINKRNVIAGVADNQAVRWTGSVGIPCTVKPFCGS